MLHRLAVLALFALAAALAGCKGPSAAQTAGGTPLLVSPEDVLTIRNSSLASGPSITGTIQPERRADLRAEVPALVMAVLRENGEAVRKGDLLVRLDDTAIRDARSSAEAASRAAEQASEQAQRQFERMATLRKSGMASAQQVEDAEIRRNNTQSDMEGARARVVSARQQMQRTEVRAPFDGVVSERKVSAGDTAQVGKELLKVIDPRSMRFEALVAADHVGEVQPGQNVTFRVNGYGEQAFLGRVRRVNPAANPTTRQVEVLVDFVGDKQPHLAGLYAEGRLETQTRSSLTIPASAVVRDGDRTCAFRVAGKKLEKVTLTLGDRDPRTGEFSIAKGLAEGDQVIRYPSALLKDGQAVGASARPGASSMAASEPQK
jgi:RND family efflux transporter MFP subunit